ncbi:MAG: site-specific integrase [Lachnospiraceae bacterium]|nr:site-specific integrase [Lachnospiraceae bacterium]
MAVPDRPEPKKREPRKRRKYKKLPNGFGCIKKLSGNRSRPFAAYPPTREFNLNGSPVSQPAIGYYKDWYQAFDALREYNNNPYDLVHNDITFSELFTLYFNAKYVNNKKKNFSQASIKSTKAAYKNCISLHERKFKDLRKYDLQSVVDNCPLKHASLELIVTLFKQMYKFAKENDITDKDYSEFVSINIPDDDESGEPFTQEELNILWKNKEHPTVQIILIMIYSGFRIKALETVKINKQKQCFKGGVKTKAGKNRIVPIHKSILQYALNFNPDTFKADYFRIKSFYPVMQQFGIDKTVSGKKHTPHDCRHTFSWLCDKYKVDELSKHLMMGHSLGGDVEKSVYGHRTIEELKTEINKIKV